MATRSIHDLAPAEVERFRADYEDGALPMRDITAGLCISTGGAYQLVARLNLVRRQVAARRARAASAVTQLPVPADAPVDLATAARALERQLVEQLLILQRRAAEAPSSRAEALSKAIANQTRALKSVRDWTGTLTEESKDDDGSPPRDLGELRDELRRHLERIRAEERGSRGLRGEAEPE